MAIKARYVHTNLTCRDWKRLVRFYCDVFGCVPTGPDRDYTGDWLDRLTSLRSAHLRGIHLLLPGYEGAGPTLEIFTYDNMAARNAPAVNEPGFGHIAFAVDDVDEVLAAVMAAGGSTVGDVVVTKVKGVGSLRVVYARDPEGNIVELQKWS
jgi:catechol 2,3-dioxygenase-like lactoylglutathione lyase family enzyme